MSDKIPAGAGQEQDLAGILAWTTEITEEAGRLAVALLRQGTRVSQKADGTVVTEVDREVERFLRQAIAARFPDHAVLGEEYGWEPGERAPVTAALWAIDPVDGTVNLANGLPHWGVSVGLILAGKPAVGVVACPLLGETFAGALGLGATRNGERLPALPPGGPTVWEDTYAFCSRSVRELEYGELPVRIRLFGSAALELCWTAAGALRGCQSIGVSLYDVAAGICLCQEVGAEPLWLSGESWDALTMREEGPRQQDVLLTAPPTTLRFVASRLAWRNGAGG